MAFTCEKCGHQSSDIGEEANNRLSKYVEVFYSPDVFQYIWDKDEFIRTEVSRLYQSENENNLIYYVDDTCQPVCKYNPRHESGTNWTGPVEEQLDRLLGDWTDTLPQPVVKLWDVNPSNLWNSEWNWSVDNVGNHDWLSEEWRIDQVITNTIDDNEEEERDNEEEESGQEGDKIEEEKPLREVRAVGGDLRITTTNEEPKKSVSSFWAYLGY